MDKIFVVIPTILANELKASLFATLQEQPLVDTVLVVDNGNCFELKDYPELTKFREINAICNLNWLSSNNLGAAIALQGDFDYVCFLNDDVQLSTGFFAGLIESYKAQPTAGLVVPRYNGVFCSQAIDHRDMSDWEAEKTETSVAFVDGTCMFLSRKTLQIVGFLDPIFRSPGWGADVDYSYRVRQAGFEVFVSHRAMLWHNNQVGGTSAKIIYGNKRKWNQQGRRQARKDLQEKYGPEWRTVLSLSTSAYCK